MSVIYDEVRNTVENSVSGYLGVANTLLQRAYQSGLGIPHAHG